MLVNSSFIEKAKGLLEESNTIVVTNHVNPDGDAVGSALALQMILRDLNKTVSAIFPNDFSNNLKWIKGSKEVLFYHEDKAMADALLSKADLIICLDYNSLKRSGSMQFALEQSMVPIMVIDHHQQPDDFAKALYSDVSMSSTCEMVFHFAMAMNWQDYMSKPVCEALYAGISTDTGNFRFNSTSPNTHKAASFLIERGVAPGTISSLIYDSNRVGRLKLLSRVLDRMEILKSCRTAILSLTDDDLKKFDFQKGDTEGFVNYGLSIENIELSVFVYEREGIVKMSFRSKTSFDVNTFARKYFNGGGHKNAAGAVSEFGLSETINRLKEILLDYTKQLQNTQPVES